MAGMRRASWLVRSMLLVAALVLAFLTAFIVVPAPVAWLLPVGVVSPEVSPWLALASLTTAIAALAASRLGRFAWIAATAAALSSIVASSPLARLPATVAHFDAAMTGALGADYLQAIPIDVSRGLRSKPFDVADFVRGLTPRSASNASETTVRGSDGATRRLVIHRPVALEHDATGERTPAPVLVQIYGGAWQRGAPDDDDAFARTLAAKGYVVCAIDYRHAPAARWPAQIEDVRSALAWVSAHAADYGGDPTRLALVGRSAGAQLALVAAYADRLPQVRAVVSYYGPIDLPEGWRQPPSPDPLGARPILETYLGGTPSEKPDAYREASPIAYVAAGVPPTLLLYGARDHVVEPRFARDLDRRLRAAGATSVLLEIPWAEHAFDAIPHGVSGQLSLYYTERFLAWAMRRNRP
jgi:acetyl esterase/lipase